LPDVNDDSGNARTLTNGGTTPFTGTDILGSVGCPNFDGSTQYLQSTDSFFDPGDTDFTYGCWAYHSNWPAANGFVCSQWNGFSNARSFGIFAVTDGIKIYGNATGGSGGNLEAIMATPSSGWIHLGVKYVASENKFYGYVNGVSANTLQLPSGLYQASSNRDFRIASGITSLYLQCKIDEFFFCRTALTDNDILKIQSAKLAHNLNVPAINQSWLCQVQGNSQTRT
jgi:hypothetical protein